METIQIESVDFYESVQRGLLCFIKNSQNKCWLKIVQEDDPDYYPGDSLTLTPEWIFQTKENG